MKTAGYEVKFTGRSGSVVRDTAVKVNLQAKGDISVSASPSFFALSPGVSAGGSVSVKLETEPSAPVTLSVEGLPVGAAMAVSQPSITVGTSFTISTTSTLAAGTYDFQLGIPITLMVE